MVLNIRQIEKKFEKCPYSYPAYCELYCKWIKDQLDIISNCKNCKSFEL